ncbi:uncharacterized protein [Rhodnius prolixus]|uniref:uncharacterized protein n=1 Tax=Rhodnius prolixus TaxID=13249 RepID=UPI003D18DA56
MNYSTISINLLLIVLLISTNCIAEEGLSRAINTSGLWSKYNLISKSNGSSNKGSLSTTLESKYSPMELQDEQDSEESEEEADDEEDEEDEEDYLEPLTTTTQRSNGKGKPPSTVKNTQKPKGDKGKVNVNLRGHKKKKGLKKLKKYMLPLLLAYKLKFFTLIPLMLGGLVLIVATTGFAGFFFALFAVGVGLKKD